jgi:hypothetical protein
MGSTRETAWTAKINRSISGYALVAAKRGSGAYKKGAQIPKFVRDYFMADARGVITDSGAVAVLKDKSKGAHSFTVTENITETESDARGQAKYGPPPRLNWDNADYVGSETDGVYYGAVNKGGTWWALASVDSDTGGFTDALIAEGGYGSEKAARIAAKDAAREWCATNNVECE